MSYSARALELAQELGEVAAANLREVGREVDHDKGTGQFVIRDADGSRARKTTPAPATPDETLASSAQPSTPEQPGLSIGVKRRRKILRVSTVRAER